MSKQITDIIVMLQKSSMNREVDLFRVSVNIVQGPIQAAFGCRAVFKQGKKCIRLLHACDVQIPLDTWRCFVDDPEGFVYADFVICINQLTKNRATDFARDSSAKLSEAMLSQAFGKHLIILLTSIGLLEVQRVVNVPHFTFLKEVK